MTDMAAKRQVGYLMDEWLRAFSWVALFMGSWSIVWAWGFVSPSSDSSSMLLFTFATQIAFVGAAYYPLIVLLERRRGTVHPPLVWILFGLAVYLTIYMGVWLVEVDGLKKLEDPVIMAPIVALMIAVYRFYRR